VATVFSSRTPNEIMMNNYEKGVGIEFTISRNDSTELKASLLPHKVSNDTLRIHLSMSTMRATLGVVGVSLCTTRS